LFENGTTSRFASRIDASCMQIVIYREPVDITTGSR
jgi:hypothetical protein